MTSAAPRKNANGDTSIRPYRIGTSSATRELACDSSKATESRPFRQHSSQPAPTCVPLTGGPGQSHGVLARTYKAAPTFPARAEQRSGNVIMG